MNTRRQWLGGLAALAASKSAARAAAAPKIMLRSGWQTVNIGDVTHTPGLLTVIEKHMPEAELILWPGNIDNGVEPMLMQRFPKLRVVRGAIGQDGKPDTPELRNAFSTANLFVHGSSAGVSATGPFESWRKSTGKPYGFFGIGFTLTGEPAAAKGDARIQQLLKGASFVFTRETASLANLKSVDIQGPRVGFAPDGTFSFDIRDDAKGNAFLKANGLESGKFIAVIPRLRVTPYQLIRKTNYTPEQLQQRTALNEKWAEHDAAKLREAIVAWVRKTGGKVLLCPEMTYEIDLFDPLLYRPLPEDVKKNIVQRKTFWLPDEAASVYAKAAVVVSSECHSPIIAAAIGTPCIYVHQPEDGIKGHMWADIGLADWYFEVEKDTGAAIAKRVLEIGANPAAAKKKVTEAVTFARRKQAEAMKVVREVTKN